MKITIKLEQRLIRFAAIACCIGCVTCSSANLSDSMSVTSNSNIWIDFSNNQDFYYANNVFIRSEVLYHKIKQIIVLDSGRFSENSIYRIFKYDRNGILTNKLKINKINNDTIVNDVLVCEYKNEVPYSRIITDKNKKKIIEQYQYIDSKLEKILINIDNKTIEVLVSDNTICYNDRICYHLDSLQRIIYVEQKNKNKLFFLFNTWKVVSKYFYDSLNRCVKTSYSEFGETFIERKYYRKEKNNKIYDSVITNNTTGYSIILYNNALPEEIILYNSNDVVERWTKFQYDYL